MGSFILCPLIGSPTNASHVAEVSQAQNRVLSMHNTKMSFKNLHSNISGARHEKGVIGSAASWTPSHSGHGARPLVEKVGGPRRAATEEQFGVEERSEKPPWRRWHWAHWLGLEIGDQEAFGVPGAEKHELNLGAASTPMWLRGRVWAGTKESNLVREGRLCTPG